MFMDISSEMIHALLPVFLVSALGATTQTVGLIEGVGEGTASTSRLFSGWISDRLGKRKLLAMIGYGLGALSKPIFAVAPTPSWVGFARFSDRLGKGIRGAPRDALVADFSSADVRGAAYGLRQSLDTVGAFVGPLCAVALMYLSGSNYRMVFWIAMLPGFVAVSILGLGVREPARLNQDERRQPMPLSHWRLLGAPFRIVVAVGAILTLARFSEAFLILRAVGAGLSPVLAPLALVLMNVVYAGTAYPIGVLSDRIDRRSLLVPGFVVLILADLVLASAHGVAVSMLGIGLWGLHMGMTQGVLAALVADTSPPDLRGTAFGVFNVVSGLALLLANLVAGGLWQQIGPSATFLAGAGFTVLGSIGAAATLRVRAGPD